MTLLEERRRLQREWKTRLVSRDVMRGRLNELNERRQRLAQAVDGRHQELVGRQNNGQPTAAAERALETAEAELDAVDKEVARGRVRVQHLDAEVQSAEDALDEFARGKELADASQRFEEMAGRAYGFLAAVGAAAIVTGVQIDKPDQLAKTAVWLATLSIGVAFLVFLPTLVSAIIDALRAHGKTGGRGATSVAWGPTVLVIRLIGFVAMFGLASASWILLLVHFGQQ